MDCALRAPPPVACRSMPGEVFPPVVVVGGETTHVAASRAEGPGKERGRRSSIAFVAKRSRQGWSAAGRWLPLPREAMLSQRQGRNGADRP